MSFEDEAVRDAEDIRTATQVWPHSCWQPEVFSLERVAEIQATFPGDLPVDILQRLAIVRFAIGAPRYGVDTWKSGAGVGRYSLTEMCNHAIGHIEKLRDGKADDCGSDPRQHLSAVAWFVAVMGYYAEAHRDVFAGATSAPGSGPF